MHKYCGCEKRKILYLEAQKKGEINAVKMGKIVLTNKKELWYSLKAPQKKQK